MRDIVIEWTCGWAMGLGDGCDSPEWLERAARDASGCERLRLPMIQ